MLSYFLPPLRFFNDTGMFVKEIWGSFTDWNDGEYRKSVDKFLLSIDWIYDWKDF